MKKLLLAVVAAAVMMPSLAPAELIVGWDFQTTATGGTAAAAAPGSPLVYQGNFGTGTLHLNGAFGSSTWTSTNPNPQVTSFAGTDVNTAGTSFSTVTSGAASLAVANSSSNGNHAVFAFSMGGREDLEVSYATQGTGTGFNTQTWAWSTDAAIWTDVFTYTKPSGSTNFANVGAVSFSTNALDFAPSAFLRVTFNGATSTAGNNRLDNIQLNAVPEPTAILMVGMAVVGCVVRRRRIG